ncbi:MAG: winged helix-turn-helix domain-containing protein [Terriglobales bacterium]
MRRIKLATHFSVEELEQRYRQAGEGIERSHWQMIWLLAQGHPAYEVARMTGYSAYWIGQLAQRYNAEGAAALVNHRRQARPSPHALLTAPEGLDTLRVALAGPVPHGDVWNSRTVAAWLSARAGRQVSAQTALTYLHKLGWTPQTPRPRHVQAATTAEREAFKKSSPAR